jgi:GxxExxY protein
MTEMDQVAHEIVDAALEVHRLLGPGLLESAYQICLVAELEFRQLRVDQQKLLPVTYRGRRLDSSYRLDMVVEDSVVVEIKSVESLLPIHQAQLLSYLKLSGYRLGLLINFNVPLLKNGIRRLIYGNAQ